VLITATTDATGLASASYQSNTPLHADARAEFGTVPIVSVRRTLTIRDPAASFVFNAYGPRPACTIALQATTQVLDHAGNHATGSVSYLGDTTVLGTQGLNSNGQTSPLDLSAHYAENLGAAYSGSTAGANANTWFVCS